MTSSIIEPTRSDALDGGDVAPAPPRKLTPAAERALAEAAERRRSVEGATALPKEIRGRGGAEPVRYGDWEVKGLASDF